MDADNQDRLCALVTEHITKTTVGKKIYGLHVLEDEKRTISSELLRREGVEP